ncbi:helix-turn-helix domain-containing protein [Promicromonospora panici]|uniref:helix-turn-helix domain-containing protein n=1 Tax=Promicromonospora panici TaxID=2219658 RepID=UPI00101B9F0D|nr:XRE family transcriptional regulator [Promicromonospora panici]
MDALIDEDTDPLGRSVARLGQRIRALRHDRSMTLVQLAHATGLSHSFLSQVERGRARLSMSSLFRVATTLGTTQQLLLAEATAPPAGSTPVVRRTDEGSASSPGGGTVRALAPAGDRPFDPMEFTGTSREPGPRWAHDEDEFVYVVEGHVLLELDGALERIGPGDSVFYRGGTHHRWSSADGEPYRLLVVKQRLAQGDD